MSNGPMQGALRPIDMARLLRHDRIKSLEPRTRTLYLELLQGSNYSGHVTDEDADAIVAHSHHRALMLDDLRRRQLVLREPSGVGWWVGLPWTLDFAEILDALGPGIVDYMAAQEGSES
jgi:hypothetical protein